MAINSDLLDMITIVIYDNLIFTMNSRGNWHYGICLLHKKYIYIFSILLFCFEPKYYFRDLVVIRRLPV